MDEMTWEIRSENHKTVSLNVGEYTAIIDDYEEHEEEMLNSIHEYFQKRSNKSVSIIDLESSESISSQTYRSFITAHYSLEEEHKIASTGMLNKKLQRDLLNNIDTEGYMNSINVLMENLLEVLDNDMPLKVKRFDHKQFIRQLSFEYDFTIDYSKLINRLIEMLPLLVEEMNEQSHHNTLLIYLYPEARLSPNEQKMFSAILKNLNVTTIVLTTSRYFFGENLNSINYMRGGKQRLTSKLIDELYWDAPLNFQREDIKNSLYRIITMYSSKFEINPTISNYQMAEIILFKPLNFYVCLSFLKECGHTFQLDLDYDEFPQSMKDYLGIVMKTV